MTQSTDTINYTHQLAEFVAQINYDNLPPDVIALAKGFMLDTIGCAMGGRAQAPEEVSWITDFSLAQNTSGVCTIFGESKKTNAMTAALTNGTMVHTIDFDDTHLPSITHLGSSLVATTFALGEEVQASGKEIIEAFVAGFEIAGRIGRCILPSHYKFWHPTATVGGIGAAAAAAKLLKLDADGIEKAMGFAGDAAGGLRYGIDNGDFSKSLHPGVAAMHAVLFAQLVKGGARAPVGILEYSAGFLNAFAEDVNTDPLLDGLGERYEISSGSMKAIPTIHCSHTAVEKVLDLVKENKIANENIAEINLVQSETIPGHGMNYAPSSPLAARLSTPFVVSLALKDGAVQLERFSEAMLADADIHAMMPRIKIQSSVELAEKHPNTIAAIVDITTTDGQTFHGEQVYPKGDPNNPMNMDEVKSKFTSLATKELGADGVEKVATQILNLEKAQNISDVTQSLAKSV